MSEDAISLPPLFSALALKPGGMDPFDKAVAEAVRGCDAGLVVHQIGTDALRAALVLAPEVPLAEAVAMLPVCGIGFQNALGALAPPEVAVHLDWDGGLRVNGAQCGGLRMAADTSDPDVQPNWLVIGLHVPLWPQSEDTGLTPEATALFAEGCTEVDPQALLESWVKHTLVWINRWSEEGVEPVHREWRGLAHGIGEAAPGGTFLGVDERFGKLIRDDTTTHLHPLTDVLESSA